MSTTNPTDPAYDQEVIGPDVPDLEEAVQLLREYVISRTNWAYHLGIAQRSAVHYPGDLGSDFMAALAHIEYDLERLRLWLEQEMLVSARELSCSDLRNATRIPRATSTCNGRLVDEVVWEDPDFGYVRSGPPDLVIVGHRAELCRRVALGHDWEACSDPECYCDPICPEPRYPTT